METIVEVRTLHDASTAVGWAGPRAVVIDRAAAAGGRGIGYNGGELLLLALGACYTNDLYREAAARGIVVRAVTVEVRCTWGGKPVQAEDVRFRPTVEAEAAPERILELIHYTDQVAEVHNSLRLGTPVTLVDPQVRPVHARAGRLRGVHRGIGPLDEPAGGVPVVREDAEAEARRRSEPVLVPAERGADRRVQLGDHRVGLAPSAEIRQDEGELVARPPRDGVDAAQACREAACHLDEQGVAREMPEPVVDRLEAVEIDEHDGQ